MGKKKEKKCTCLVGMSGRHVYERRVGELLVHLDVHLIGMCACMRACVYQLLVHFEVHLVGMWV